jgi:hypothetical protein
MTKVVAGTVIAVGACGEDDVTSVNLEQMAATLGSGRPPTDADRRELVVMLRWLAKLVRSIEASADSPAQSTARRDRPLD